MSNHPKLISYIRLVGVTFALGFTTNILFDDADVTERMLKNGHAPWVYIFTFIVTSFYMTLLCLGSFPRVQVINHDYHFLNAKSTVAVNFLIFRIFSLGPAIFNLKFIYTSFLHNKNCHIITIPYERQVIKKKDLNTVIQKRNQATSVRKQSSAGKNKVSVVIPTRAKVVPEALVPKK